LKLEARIPRSAGRNKHNGPKIQIFKTEKFRILIFEFWAGLGFGFWNLRFERDIFLRVLRVLCGEKKK
jgi:hypothetical protein